MKQQTYFPPQTLLSNSFETLSFCFWNGIHYQDWKPRFKENREALLLSISIATNISIRKEENIALDSFGNGIFQTSPSVYSWASAEEQKSKAELSSPLLSGGCREGRQGARPGAALGTARQQGRKGPFFTQLMGLVRERGQKPNRRSTPCESIYDVNN